MRVVIKAGLNTHQIGLGHTRRVRNNLAKCSTFPTRSSPFLGASPSAFPSSIAPAPLPHPSRLRDRGASCRPPRA